MFSSASTSTRAALAVLLLLQWWYITDLSAEGQSAKASSYRVVRLNDGKPVVTREMFAKASVPDEGENINGPSVIRIPNWLLRSERAASQANYYMYFARHGADQVGDYIRLAWAENIEGPWTLYHSGADISPGSRGVLDTGADGIIEVPGGLDIAGSIGSPDVVVDDPNQRIVMYFHAVRKPRNVELDDKGRERRKTAALVATSRDGLNFNQPDDGGQTGHGIRPHPLGRSYFRTFEVDGWLYAVANKGTMYRAPAPGSLSDPDAIWAQGWERDEGPLRRVYEAGYKRQGIPPEAQPTFRHFSVLPVDKQLHVFFSRKRDIHERIMMAVIDVSGNADWKEWPVSFPPQEILKPEMDWEGIDRPFEISRLGRATGVRQLRDPYVLKDEDGSLYLFYTGRGEEAIGVAQLFHEP